MSIPSRLYCGLCLLCGVAFIQCAPEQPADFPASNDTTLRFPPVPPDEVQELPGRSLLVRNVDLLDGIRRSVQPGMDVLVRDGTIVAIGTELDGGGVPVLDGTGQTMLPGLITAHAHLQSVPGAVLRNDSPSHLEIHQNLQLRAYLAGGFTSVLDPGISPGTARRFRSYLEKGHPGPEVFLLAPFLTPEDGYFGLESSRTHVYREFWEPVSSVDTVRENFQKARTLNPSGVKVTVEEGMIVPIWPLFSDSQLDMIRNEARAMTSPIYVHSLTPDAHLKALKLQPHALVHAGFRTTEATPEIIDTIKAAGPFVITTIALDRLFAWILNKEFTNDPWVRQRVPIAQYETAAHERTRDLLFELVGTMTSPTWAPSFMIRALTPLMSPSEEDYQEATARSGRAVVAMWKKGVPLVLGADDGNWPVLTTYFHGVSSQIELETLEDVGIPPADIIRAATSNAATMLGVQNRIGSIEVGKEADMVLVPKNPLTAGMKVFRDLTWTINNGVAKSPGAWLTMDVPMSDGIPVRPAPSGSAKDAAKP